MLRMRVPACFLRSATMASRTATSARSERWRYVLMWCAQRCLAVCTRRRLRRRGPGLAVAAAAPLCRFAAPAPAEKEDYGERDRLRRILAKGGVADAPDATLDRLLEWKHEPAREFVKKRAGPSQ